MSKCADCNELVGEEWSANNGLCSTCARDELSKPDTNQASEDKLENIEQTFDEKLDAIIWELTDSSGWDLIGITQAQSDALSEQLRSERAEAKQAILDWHNKRELQARISELQDAVTHINRGQHWRNYIERALEQHKQDLEEL